jgi:hypothetical protein
MRYLLLINKNEAKYRELTDEERKALHARYEAYGRKMVAAGVLKGGAMLEATDTATTVRVRDGKRLITDGPFAETTEQVAGIGIIDVANLDEALEWAAGHPDAEWASVEVRPIVPWERPQ